MNEFVPAPDELKADIDALESWVKAIQARRVTETMLSVPGWKTRPAERRGREYVDGSESQ